MIGKMHLEPKAEITLDFRKNFVVWTKWMEWKDQQRLHVGMTPK